MIIYMRKKLTMITMMIMHVRKKERIKGRRKKRGLRHPLALVYVTFITSTPSPRLGGTGYKDRRLRIGRGGRVWVFKVVMCLRRWVFPAVKLQTCLAILFFFKT